MANGWLRGRTLAFTLGSTRSASIPDASRYKSALLTRPTHAVLAWKGAVSERLQLGAVPAHEDYPQLSYGLFAVGMISLSSPRTACPRFGSKSPAIITIIWTTIIAMASAWFSTSMMSSGGNAGPTLSPCV